MLENPESFVRKVLKAGKRIGCKSITCDEACPALGKHFPPTRIV